MRTQRNIYKRKDGRWEGRYFKEYDSKGKIKYGSVYAKTYYEVKVKLNNIVPDFLKIPKKKIETLTPKEVAYLMGMGVPTIEKGLIQGIFPWGYAIRTSENKHRYFINAKKFFATEMISV